MEPNIPKYISIELRLASAKVRLRKKRSGSMGAAERLSHAMNALSSATPIPIEPTTVRLVQPSGLPRTIP